MIQLMLKSVLLMLFSSSYSLQVILSLLVLGVWTFYSLMYCPYPKFCRFFIHLNEIILLGQNAILMLSVNSAETSRITPAYVLLILNGVQILLMGIFSLCFLFSILFGMCEMEKKSNNKIGNIY